MARSTPRERMRPMTKGCFLEAEAWSQSSTLLTITTDECTPQARVRMFYEDNKDPVIHKSWDATSSQLNNKRRRDASCSQ
jgi:hypothetical protein